MDWRAADAGGERFPICGLNVADRKRRERDLAQPGSASYSARTGPGKRRARSGCAAFSSELAFARPAGVRSHEDSIRHRRIRFDCSTCGNRSDPPNMARLGIVTRATRTFRLSHDAGNNRAPETTRRLVIADLINTWLYSSSQSIDSSNLRNCGLSAESTGNHSPTGSRFHHAVSPIGANR